MADILTNNLEKTKNQLFRSFIVWYEGNVLDQYPVGGEFRGGGIISF